MQGESQLCHCSQLHIHYRIILLLLKFDILTIIIIIIIIINFKIFRFVEKLGLLMNHNFRKIFIYMSAFLLSFFKSFCHKQPQIFIALAKSLIPP